LLVSLALIGLLVHSVDLRDTIRPIPEHGWVYVFLMALLANIDRVLMSYKWNLLLKARRLGTPFGRVVRSYYVGTLWGLLLPTGVGGDIVRSFAVGARGSRSGDVFSSVVLERVLGLTSGLCLGIVAAALMPLVIDDPNENLIAAAMVLPLLVVVSLIAISFSDRPARWLRGRLPLPRPVLAKLKDVYDSYQLYGRDQGLMIRFLLWSLIEQCIPVLCVFLASLALETKARFVEVAVFVPIIMIPARLPISFDGLGVREALYVYFFSFVEIPAAEALRLGFVSHVLGLLSMLPGFLYFSVYSEASSWRSPRHGSLQAKPLPRR
jgi:uncharacterized protein (TIRG00374 family)